MKCAFKDKCSDYRCDSCARNEDRSYYEPREPLDYPRYPIYPAPYWDPWEVKYTTASTSDFIYYQEGE